MAWATRSAAAARETLQIYDVAHNVAKLERHGGRELCVHRKGSTRSLPPGAADVPEAYQGVGQPVFIPGSMGTASFVLVGRPGSRERSFGSACHGAGRRMSRTRAKREITGGELRPNACSASPKIISRVDPASTSSSSEACSAQR